MYCFAFNGEESANRNPHFCSVLLSCPCHPPVTHVVLRISCVMRIQALRLLYEDDANDEERRDVLEFDVELGSPKFTASTLIQALMKSELISGAVKKRYRPPQRFPGFL